MCRSRLAEASLIGCLTALACFCAVNARGEETYSIVGQSSRSSAATGRRPLAERITAANLPIITPTASTPPRVPRPQAARPEAATNADRAEHGENMAVAAVQVNEPEPTAATPPRPAVTPPVLWPFGTKRAETKHAEAKKPQSTKPHSTQPVESEKRPATTAWSTVVKNGTLWATGHASQRQADARSSGNGLSNSRPAAVTR